jgi:hypothetical protein
VGFSDPGYRGPKTRAFAAVGSTATHAPPLCQSGARKRALSARGHCGPCAPPLLPTELYSFVDGVQLRLLRQRVAMTAQNAQAEVLLHRLHYALPGWDAAAERRDAQDEFHSAAQARAWAG